MPLTEHADPVSTLKILSPLVRLQTELVRRRLAQLASREGASLHWKSSLPSVSDKQSSSLFRGLGSYLFLKRRVPAEKIWSVCSLTSEVSTSLVSVLFIDDLASRNGALQSKTVP